MMNSNLSKDQKLHQTGFFGIKAQNDLILSPVYEIEGQMHLIVEGDNLVVTVLQITHEHKIKNPL